MCAVLMIAGLPFGPLSPVTRAPSQYPKRRVSVRSRKVSKPRDLYLELSYCSEIWQALRQQCCRCAFQISKRYNLKYQSRGFETLRDLMERRLFGYWDGAQVEAGPIFSGHWVPYLFFPDKSPGTSPDIIGYSRCPDFSGHVRRPA